MSFGDRFKELRLKKGLKQQELVDDFNNIYNHTFTKSSISQYENNKRIPETEALKNFSLYFDVSVDYLLGVSNDKHSALDKSHKDLMSDTLVYINEFFGDENIKREEKDKLFKDLSKLYFDSLK